MKSYYCVRLVASVVAANLLFLSPRLATAQWSLAGPDTQRNAIKLVQTQVGWLQNGTMTASSYTYSNQGYYKLERDFQGLRDAYSAFKQKLSAQQVAYGANGLAQLDAGLDIVQEAFANYQEDLSAGRPPAMAMGNLCRVLNQGSAIWLQEFNTICRQLYVGAW
jgi:hypothetical protein